MLKNRRRNYFIDKPFQLRFILTFCVIVIASTIIVGGILLYFSTDSITGTIGDTKVVIKGSMDYLFPLLFQTLMIVTLFASLSVIVLTLFISHKISGPLFHISRIINNLKQGDLRTYVHIREKDQVRMLADTVNSLIDVLRDKCHSIKKGTDHLKGMIADPGRYKKEIEEQVTALEEVADYFKI